MCPRVFVLAGLVISQVLGWLVAPAVAHAGQTSILISEVQLAGAGSGHSGDEFIELYNPTPRDVSLEKWVLQYHAASPCTSGWSTKATIGKLTIKGYGYALFSATGYLPEADAHFTAGLSGTAGNIRLSDATGAVADAVAWGSGATCGEGTSAAAPHDGQSLERRPGADNEQGGNAVDTGDNVSDFLVRTVPGPQTLTSAPETPNENVDPTEAVPVDYPALEITELLVDPVAPQTDAKDEYIELHNPGSEPVQVGGYALTIGSSSYHLLPTVLAPNEYLVVTAATSKLALSNGGGTLTLADPSGDPMDAAAPWSQAPAGAAWALFDDGWGWTTTPTPGKANVYIPSAGPDGDTTAPVPDDAPTYPVLKLSELLPDPASPLTDANDEFIELYNPGDEPINLAGYVVKVGSTLGKSYVLPDAVVDAHGYWSVKASESKLALANDGSSVALYDPAGRQLDLTQYTAAKEDTSWALGEAGWGWTTTLTAGAANVITAPVAVAKVAKTATTTTKVAPKVKAPAKPKATKAAAVKKAKTKAATTAKKALASATTPGGHWLLFALAGLTMGYVIYEFRYDVRNYYHKLRRHAGPRR